LEPGLPRSVGLAPTRSPHAWPARWYCPGWPPTSPACRQHGSGPAAAGAAAPTPRPAATHQPPPTGHPAAAAQLSGWDIPPGPPRFAAHRRSPPPRCGRALADGHLWAEAAEPAAAARSPPTIHREQAPQRSWAEILTQTRRVLKPALSVGPGGVFVVDSKQYRAASSWIRRGGCGMAATPSPRPCGPSRSRPTRPPWSCPTRAWRWYRSWPSTAPRSLGQGRGGRCPGRGGPAPAKPASRPPGGGGARAGGVPYRSGADWLPRRRLAPGTSRLAGCCSCGCEIRRAKRAP
jgi:hypothetical protein